jgi:hypothetical protein
METEIVNKQPETNLIDSILNIQVNNEDLITEYDHNFCQLRQKMLYESLDQIDHWYAIFKKEAEKFKDWNVSFDGSGHVDYRDPHYYQSVKDYTEYEFRPFKIINELVEKRLTALRGFRYDIVDYFNDAYNIHAKAPDIDNTIAIDFRPDYMSLVNMVIDYIGGKDFREKAEEELISEFANKTKYKTVNLQGDKIIIHSLVSIEYRNFIDCYQVMYSSIESLSAICRGIVFVADNFIKGGTDSIIDFDDNNLRLNNWYSLRSQNVTGIRFYKNGRVDFRFKDKATAERCYKKLGLEQENQ